MKQIILALIFIIVEMLVGYGTNNIDTLPTEEIVVAEDTEATINIEKTDNTTEADNNIEVENTEISIEEIETTVEETEEVVVKDEQYWTDLNDKMNSWIEEQYAQMSDEEKAEFDYYKNLEETEATTPAPEPLNKTEVVTSNECIIPIITEGSVSEDNLKTLQRMLSMIPEYRQQQFVDSGWTMYLTTADLTEGLPYKSVRGRTYLSSQQIKIDNRNVAVTESPIHEFGHFLDYSGGWYSTSNEFTEIFNAEYDSFCNNFDSQCIRGEVKEYFAECYNQYIRNSEKLQSACPQTYQYLSVF